MPAKKPTRTLRMRRLAAELRRLRESAGLSREDVTAATRINGSTLYRVESAQARPQLRTLHTLCDLYGVDEAEREELLALTKDSGKQGWLETYPSELPTEYTNYILFESEARTIRNYESLFVPGLLQTEDYARAVIRGTVPLATDEQVEDRVRARLQRQELLHGTEPLRLRAIVDEAVLRRVVGGPCVMREQLLHLGTMAKLPHVEVQVIRFESGAHPGMPGSFVLIDFPEPADPAVVYIDSMAGDLFLEGDVEVDRYSLILEQLIGVALSPDESRQLIGTVAAGMTAED
ncbi:helix-turn-helix domain-containing protein [Nocardiopsis sp. NPDC006938]|uniref:helix-turn-helix domain-containing protein n=1 Tax=Nocardiopsis sp. NPDC006938 TaxID=3364337 RepID=UPI00368E050A